MAHILSDADRILEQTTSTGTGAITLNAAVTGFRRFSAVCAIGDTVPYFIEAIDTLGQPTGDYEYGIGTYSAANQLTRTQVMGSSNAGAAVNFVAGTKNVGVCALGRDLVPTGSKHEFPCTTAPAGYLIAQGQLVSRAAYPALWQFAQASGNIAASDAAWSSGGLSTCGQFSPGDGSTTFRLPDWRGMHSRAADIGRGIDADRTVGSYQADQFPSHTHPYNDATAVEAGDIVHTLTGGPSSIVTGKTYTNSNVATATSASGTGTETRVKSLAFLWCIKT